MKYLQKIILAQILILCINQNLNAQQASFGAPVEFIENKGQWDAPFSYKGSSPWANFYLRQDGIRFLLSDLRNKEFYHGIRHGDIDSTYMLKYHAYDMLFINSNKNVQFESSKRKSHYYNYYIGSDQQRWKSEVYPTLNVDYKNLYDGIDAHLYSEQENLKYDFIVKPQADASLISWKYDGLDQLSLTTEGQLLLKTSLGDIKEMKPYCYQFVDGEKVEVSATYKLTENIVSFDFPKGYNKNETLIIDPTIVFCSFTGSTVDNWGFTATYDSLGNFYAGGIVIGDGGSAITGAYPVTVGVIQPNFGGGVTGTGIVPTDVSISKFNSAGNALIYATYFGGTENEQPHSMIVDYAGNLVIAGRTFSPQSSFPLTGSQYDGTYNGGGDLFVAKFNPTGTVLLGCTYVGGSGEESINGNISNSVIGGLKHNYADDARSEVIVDLQNNVYVASCTKSTNFPTVLPLQNNLGGGQDAAVIQLNSTLTSLLWSTYLGGAGNDAAYVLAINKTNPNEIFIGGGTESSTFPTTAGTWHPTYQGGQCDGFLLKFNTVSKSLLAGTFIGTNSYDQVFGVQTNDSNHVYIVGQTTGAYQVTPGVYTNPNSSQFMTKLNNNLSTPLFSTVFGKGNNSATDIAINAFLVDKCENIYISGWGGPITTGNQGNTTGLPISSNALQTTTDGSDYYFFVLSKNFQNLVYASFFGQNGGGGEHVDGGTSRFDENGVIYQAICSACGGGTQNFPVTSGAYSTTKAQATNCNLGALKIKFDFQNPQAEAVISGDTIGCAPLTINFINNSTSASTYFWDFGDGTTSTQVTPPAKTYSIPGTYVVKLIAFNPDGCTANTDTAYRNITVRPDSLIPNFTVSITDSCNSPFTVSITNTSSTNVGPIKPSTTFTWNFGDGNTTTVANPLTHGYTTSAIYTITLTMTDTSFCNSPAVITRVVDFSASNVKAAFTSPDSICIPAVVNFANQSTSSLTWEWKFGDGNTSTQQNPSNNYLTPGTYTVTLISRNPNTCNKIDSIKKTLTILGSPVADFDWSPNPPEANKATTFTNQSIGATSYLWDFGDGSTSTQKDETHIYQKDGTYNVCLTATNQVGCRDSICKPVRGIVIPLAEVPSGFSPNGDGFNDFVYVKGYGIQNMTFRIFNRWGEKVFETKDKKTGWDGRYKGMLQEMEVYQYTLNVEFFDGTKSFKKGNITLLK